MSGGARLLPHSALWTESETDLVTEISCKNHVVAPEFDSLWVYISSHGKYNKKMEINWCMKKIP